MHEEIIKYKLSKKYLYTSLSILCLIFVCVIVRLTPMTNNYWLNFFTILIVKNIFSLSVISIFSFSIFIIELMKYKQKTNHEKGVEENG